MSNYSEEQVLWHYIVSHYSSLLTDAESKALRNIQVEQKIEGLTDQKYAQHLRSNTGFFDNEAANKLLQDGVESFRSRTCKRILTECSDQLLIKRCPKCNKIVRTPKAQQCFWCGHDWHSSDDKELASEGN